MPYEDQRSRWAALRADQELIDRAATRLRHETAQAQYAGLRDPPVATSWRSTSSSMSFDDGARVSSISPPRSRLKIR
jgi:hypothetical protein